MNTSKKKEQEEKLINFLSSHSDCFVVNTNGIEKSIIQLLTSMMRVHDEFEYGYADVVVFRKNHASYKPSSKRIICTKPFIEEFCRKYKFTIKELISKWIIAETSLADYSESKTNRQSRDKIVKKRKSSTHEFKSKSRVTKAKKQSGNLSYEKQLKTKEWKEKRRHIFETKGRKCSICGTTTEILQIHHVRYLSGRLAWEYKDKYLVVVCQHCHQKIHGFRTTSGLK